MLEMDKKAIEAGRFYVEHEVHVGAMSQPDGFAD
jgi:hypothetical protein